MSKNSVDAINERLKAANIPVRIRQRGNTLALRATLPPKPAGVGGRPGVSGVTAANKQQDIYLNIQANAAGLKRIEAEAQNLGALITLGKFTWDPYLRKLERSPDTVQELIARFELDYFTKRERNSKSETTWNKDYWQILKRLPPNEPLTAELMLQVIRNTKADSKPRKRACFVLKAFAKFAGVELDVEGLAGKYGSQDAAPRDLPSDRLIAQVRDEIKNPAWQWVYGMIACYGLRNYEWLYLHNPKLLHEQPGIIELSDSKTGPREVWPFYPEWWERWQLWDIKQPEISGPDNSELGHRVTNQFRRMGIPFSPLNLRHAWAVRTIHFGMPDTVAARMMGHSVEVHTKIYHRWLTREHYRQVFNVIMVRPDRPQAP